MAVGVPLGPYRLVRRLATGGMAEIFLARQEGPDGFARELVVKRILPHLAADPEFTRMFRDEAKLAALLSHPNAVHVYDFGAVEDAGGTTLYLAMELVRGVDLRALILRALSEARRTGRAGAIPVHHATKIASFVCEALAHAHSVRIDGRPAGIVHRDVTPSNVLMSFDGAVKLADFGIAKAATTASDRTEHGVVKGKHTYLSPEQARGDALDARSDLFNVGILIFESVLGEALFPPSDQRLARRLSARGEIPRPERFERIPSALATIALKALSAQREDRYPDGLALRSDLEAFLRTCPEPSDTVELGRFVRQMCAEELSEDAQGPRAAGTVASKKQGRGTAQLTGSSVAAPSVRLSQGTQPLSAAQGPSSARAAPASASARASHRALATAQSASTTQPLAEAVTTDPTSTAVVDDSTEAALSAAGSGIFTHTGATGLTPADASALVPAPPTGSLPQELSAVGRSPHAPPAALTTPIVRSRPTSWTGPIVAASIVAIALGVAIALVAGGTDDDVSRGTLPRTASLTVTSDPAGARVFVDGVEHGSTPAQVTTLMPGRAVRLEVRDPTGRVLDAQEISLGEGEHRDVALRATPPSGRVRVSSEPTGAMVSIDGREAGTTPLDVEVPIGEHRVRVTLSGHAEENDTVRVERAGDRATLSFSLRPERARPALTAPAPVRDPGSRPATPRGEPRPAPSTATGTLRVATTPWSIVFEGSRRLGETPLQVELPAGRHVLTLRASDRPARTETVEIREGEVTRVRVIL